MKANIVLLPGDGIGPEIVDQAAAVLTAVADRFGHEFSFSSHLIGGIAIDTCGDPLPQETVDACSSGDAILLGAVGGPKWDDPSAKTRPEAGLSRLTPLVASIDGRYGRGAPFWCAIRQD